MKATIEERLRAVWDKYTERDEESGCLNWLSTMSGASESTPTFGGYSVRRVIMRANGQKVEPAQRIVPKCKNPCCVEIAHFARRGAREHLRIMQSKSAKSESRIFASREASRRRSKVGSMHRAEMARAAESDRAAAAMLGISVQQAHNIRAGKAWRRPPSSVFELGAMS